MKTHLRPFLRTTASFSASLLLATATTPYQSNASCGSGTPTITNVPGLGGTFYQVRALNANGEVAGYSYLPGDMELHAFKFGVGGLADLGTLGGTSSLGYALNNSGQVVGEATLTNDLATRGFIYNGTAIVDLGTLGGDYSAATGINDAGQVVGNAEIDADANLQAFLYSAGSMIGLGHLGGNYSTAAAINQGGKVVGSSLTALSEFRGFLYSNGSMIDLGTLGGGSSVAYALNDSDRVVGDSTVTNGETHGFVYAAGVMTDVGTLGGTFSTAYGINNAGQVIGTAATAGDLQFNGFIYSSGTIKDLGTLGGNYSTPHAINDFGQVVGESPTAAAVTHAFFWENGSMTDLNVILPANSGWELNSASFINNAGRIVGEGTLNGVHQWFILDLGSANTPPVANAGADQTSHCNGQVTLNGTQSSDPDGDVLTYQWRVGGVVLGTNATLTVSFDAGSHTVTLKVTDPCGDSAEDTVVVEMIADTTPPTITCPSSVNGGGSGNCETIVPDVRPLVAVSDNCTPASALIITQSPTAGTVLGSGQYTITVTVTDASGNSATGTTAITVADNQPPVITGVPKPNPIQTGHDGVAEVPDLTQQLVARDNCTPTQALVVTQNPAPGTLLSRGDYDVTLTVADAAGNSASKQVSLHIVGPAAPKLTITSNKGGKGKP